MIWVTFLSISDRCGEPFIHHAFHSFDDLLQVITSSQSSDGGNGLEALNNENVSRREFKAHQKMTRNSIRVVILM